MIKEHIFNSFLVMALSASVGAHGGATIESGPLKGCHNNRKIGTFHCHSHSDNRMNMTEFASREDASSRLLTIVETPQVSSTRYDRSKFKHWIDEDGNCLNTRHEVLKSRSVVEVKLKGCRVVEGEWKDFYYDEVLHKAAQIDIDHVIPLKNAWSSGASKWTALERERFANDPENLVITNLKYNRSKGAKTPLEWIPLDKRYACNYLKQWIRLKEKYSLKMNPTIISDYERMRCIDI